MIDFKNKNILITGATGGIGGALVKKFVSLEEFCRKVMVFLKEVMEYFKRVLLIKFEHVNKIL